MTKRAIGLSVVLATSLYAGSLTVNSGWNLSGAIGDISSANFSGSNGCVKALWTYDNGSWSLYHRDVTSHGYPILASIPEATGFWALVDSTPCSIDYGDAITTGGAIGTIVDPYISGATLYQDDNNNSMWDSGEFYSTASDTNGSFAFNDALTPGKNIRIKTQGMHEGETYDLDIAAVVNTQGGVDVVSPLTTLESKGLTSTQIAEIFNLVASDDGITSFTASASSILSDPLQGGLKDKVFTQITDAELNNIQASLAGYGLLKVMEGSTTLKALSGNELYMSGTTTSGALYNIAKVMLRNLTNSLNRDKLSNINDMTTSLKLGLNNAGQTALADAVPEPTLDIILGIATSIVDRLAEVGYTTCNATSGTDSEKVTAALGQVGTTATALFGADDAEKLQKMKTYGMKFMGIKMKEQMSGFVVSEQMLTGMTSAGMPADIVDMIRDLSGGVSDTGTSFRFDETNSFGSIGAQ